ncbi:hypothetical protein NX02_14420 [Sphingomonas sanxanigenens DSM 19645 = NX02]|uniref:J domain-containing protein n=2 Tax=Sphingomonas sanxanigenens TaxID=397260 RepID=W0A9H8_9SPHN|nr:hypothetical protein NX02_14420 [Sphingomonas sanxanigenens DSM 19645 = NX02]
MWAVLGIAPTTDSIEIRRAYARRLKESDVGEDADAFAELRMARADALAWAADRDATAGDDDPGDPAAVSDDGSRVAELSATYGLTGPVLADVDVDHGVVTRAPVPDEELGIAATPPFARVDRGSGEALRLDRSQWAVPELDITPGDGRVVPQTMVTDDDYQAMAALLFPEKGEDAGPMSAEEIALWMTHLDRVFADPRMGELGYYGDVERWLSEVLAGSVPRSDPLLATVAERFGWMANADEVGETPAIAHITARVGALSFVEAVQSRGHRYRRAWRELTAPADAASRRGWVRRKNVLELLEMIRRHHPQLEQSFDWYRVQLWEAQGNAGGREGGGAASGLVIAGLILAFNLLRIFSSTGNDDPAPVSVAPPIEARSNQLDAPANDIPAAIEWASNGAYRPADLATRNPDLLEDLQRIWQDDKAAGERRDMFDIHIADHLTQRFPRIVEKASHAALADLLRIRIEAVRRAGQSPQDCADEILGRKLLPPEFDRRYRAAKYRILIETRGKMRDVEGDGTFWIDHDTMVASAKRAGMSTTDLSAGLDGKGGPKGICEARIALIETVLALPEKKAMKMLPYL